MKICVAKLIAAEFTRHLLFQYLHVTVAYKNDVDQRTPAKICFKQKILCSVTGFKYSYRKIE